MKTVETSAIMEPMAGRRRYVQGIPADDSAVSSFLPVRDLAQRVPQQTPEQTF